MKTRKLVTSLLCFSMVAAMTTAFQPVTASAAYPSNSVTEGLSIARANSIVVNSNDAAAELSILKRLNNGKLPEIDFTSANYAERIHGIVSSRVVTSESIARGVISDVSHLIGIKNLSSEVKYVDCIETKDTTTYTYMQVYQGIKVTNSYITVMVDNQTKKATYLTSSFTPNLSAKTKAGISTTAAKNAVVKKYNATIVGVPSLVLFKSKDGRIKLAYDVEVRSKQYSHFYVDAQNSSILFVPNNRVAETESVTIQSNRANPITGKKAFSILVDKQYGARYTIRYFHDPYRNIWILRSNDAANSLSSDNAVMIGNANHSTLAGQQVLNNLSATVMQGYTANLCTSQEIKQSDWDQYAVEAGMLSQAAYVYDYYKYYFGWAGTDGESGNLFINPFLQETNAWAWSYYNCLEMGAESDLCYSWAKDLNVLAHEYTHRVTNNRVLWSESQYSGEIGALMEAYSDIMSEYASTADTRTWIQGDEVYKSGAYVRDITHGNAYWYNGGWQYFNARNITSTTEPHSGSTVISHVAYLMDREYGIPEILGKQIWFNSMAYMKQGGNQTNFADCRNAVISAAEDLLNKATYYTDAEKKNYLRKIHTAFNFAHVFTGDCKIGDINMDGTVNTSDVNMMRSYLLGSITSLSPEAIAYVDLNFDGEVDIVDLIQLQNAVSENSTAYL